MYCLERELWEPSHASVEQNKIHNAYERPQSDRFCEFQSFFETLNSTLRLEKRSFQSENCQKYVSNASLHAIFWHWKKNCLERELDSGNCLTTFLLGLTMQTKKNNDKNQSSHARGIAWLDRWFVSQSSHNKILEDLNRDCETVGYLQQIVIQNMWHYWFFIVIYTTWWVAEHPNIDFLL